MIYNIINIIFHTAICAGIKLLDFGKGMVTNMQKKKYIAILLSLIVIITTVGCGIEENKNDNSVISGLDTKENITLQIAIPYETNKALNTVSNAFMKKYPNVNIQLQYVEDYDVNAVQLFKENALDMILQKDIPYTEYTKTDENSEEKILDGTTTDDFFYDFGSDTEIDFSDTIPEISNNYRHTRTDEQGNEITYQYSYPLGGETRGVFVNTTLLDAYGLAVPTNYIEFIDCCKVLKENGLIPIQGGADTASYGLGIAPAANAVVHNAEALDKMRTAQSGISEEFTDVLTKLYDIATNRYFDYKELEKQGYFQSTNELGQAESFLGLRTDPNTFEVHKPENNYGYAAFLPYISSTETVINSLIEEYELDTKVTFICSPLNKEGESSAVYITPYFGICANKNSKNLPWIKEFINFLFQEENNYTYAKDASIIPNTADALKYTAKKYNVDIDKDITLCGQIRFSDDYNGFTPLSSGLKEVLKCSAQKYMVNLNKDAEGNIQYACDENGRRYLYMENEETKVEEAYVGKEDPAKPGYAFCTLEYYENILEEAFGKYRENENAQ